MYSTDYIFTGPAELYVDKVKVGWTRDGLKLRTNKSLYFRPSMYGVGHDAVVKQNEEYYVSTVMSEATFENMRIAWGLTGDITNPNATSANKTIYFGGELTIPEHVLKFRSMDRALTVVIYRAVAADFGEMTHTKNQEVFIPVTFKALLDTTKVIGSQIGYMTYGNSSYENELTCRVSVKEIRKFLAAKLTVRKKTTKTLTTRLTSLKNTTKSIVMRLTSRPIGRKSLVGRVTVA